MRNLNNNLPPRPRLREDKLFIVTLTLFILGFLELFLKAFRCELGEFYSLFWLHFIFVTALFYWPNYLSGNSASDSQPAWLLPTQSNWISPQFRLFFSAVMKAAYYLLAVSLVLILVLAIFQKRLSDSLILLPLLFFWPRQVYRQFKPNIKLAILPLSISLFTIIAIQFTNPANPNLKTFNSYLNDFEAVAAMVKSGEIELKNYPGVSEVELPCNYRHLVGCPNRKIRVEKDRKTTVIFFCNELWPLKSGKTEFIYRSDGQDISVQPSSPPNTLEIRRLNENWFWKSEKFTKG